MSHGGAQDEPPHDMIPVPDALARPAARAALAALPGARAVGGCVRDALAGLPISDLDVAVPLPPEEASARLRAAGLRVFDTGLAHGTVTAVLDREPVEVTSLRRDVATDGRHAVVEWTTDWREDAARRDFTINAMSLSAEGGLWDWFGGRDDLARGVVRFVGDPATRLREDHLRALRFFRFHARYGRGEPDAAAVVAIREAVRGGGLARLSAERVWGELKRILAAPDPTGAVALMAETGVLGAVLPEAEPPRLDVLARAVAAGVPPDPALRLVLLLPDAAQGTGEGVAARLRMSGEERDVLVWFGDSVEWVPDVAAGMVGGTLRRWLASRANDPRLAVQETWVAEARDGESRAALRARIAATPPPGFPLFGRDVVALGVPPGPGVGRLLSEVEDWWLEGGCVADADACRAHLADVLARERA